MAKHHFRITPLTCRACGDPIGLLDDICPHCAAAAPVQYPAWIGYVLIALSLRTLLICLG
jgi:hypothetical protein